MERKAEVAAGVQRVFFALWPDDAVRFAIAQAARRMHRVLHGRRTRDESIHLTVAFLGEVDIDEFARLQALPHELLTEPFRLVLDRWDCWPRNRIGWAAPSQMPDSLRLLSGNLESWLGSNGFHLDQRAFTPHVTLIRDAQYAAMPDPLAPIEWHVAELVLVRSQLLQIAARWPLA